MRRLLLVAACAALNCLALPAHASAATACSGDPTQPQRLDLVVHGQPAYGLYTLPSGPPRGLVVFGHGYGYTVDAWRLHMTKTSQRDGVIAVAMNYRGLIDLPRDRTGFERSRGWPAAAGAEDLVAAAQHFDRTCPGLPGIELYGVSMGGNMTGLAMAARAKRIDGRPLFDYWFAVEGAHNVTEEYQGARVVAQSGNAYAKGAVEDIEREMGGSFEMVPSTYFERTNVNRTDDIAASGVRGVVLVHAREDGLVPYDQSQQLAERLRAVGVPVDFYSVGRLNPGQDPSTNTTISGYAGQDTGNAGHGSEWSPTHVVVQTGFDRLNAQLTRGDPAPCNRNFEVNESPSNVSPDPRSAPSGCQPDPLPPAGAGCRDTSAPPRVRAFVARRGRRIALRGRATDRGCGRVARVQVSVARVSPGGRRCRFLRRARRSRRLLLGRQRACRRSMYVPARGRESWRLRLPRGLPRGRYRAVARAVDAAGNRGRPGRPARFRVR